MERSTSQKIPCQEAPVGKKKKERQISVRLYWIKECSGFGGFPTRKPLQTAHFIQGSGGEKGGPLSPPSTGCPIKGAGYMWPLP